MKEKLCKITLFLNPKNSTFWNQVIESFVLGNMQNIAEVF
jgi:hypothetical protein